ncbi:hypothetical protein EV589_5954 [Mycobacterium sp. BK558]|nr:hypothetical protein EV589_5954 [Mycobacterium sp. BK558]
MAVTAEHTLSDEAVIWPLVDAGVHQLSAAERGALFADIAAGDYLPAAERLLRASMSAGDPLPAAVLASVELWLDRYVGSCEQPALRHLVRQLTQMNASSLPHTLGNPLQGMFPPR